MYRTPHASSPNDSEADDSDVSCPLPGTPPGIESMPGIDVPPEPGDVRIDWIDYSEARLETHSGSLEDLLASPRPEWARTRWIAVEGLHQYVVNRLRQELHFHTLTAEDILRTSQRPKIEMHTHHLYTVARTMRLEGDQLQQEQVSLLLWEGTLLTFLEGKGTLWDPIRQRLARVGSRARKLDTSYLFYMVLDAIVDHFFPILECYNDRLETLEDAVLTDAGPELQQSVHCARRELAQLRRVVWPLRDLVSELQRDESGRIHADVRTFLRDVHDHVIQLIEIVEMHREHAAGLSDLYMTAVSNRMNEIMKVLTIMASFFIPITFLAGVYGMNFSSMPELSWKYSYALFWLLCVSIVGGLGWYFVRKGWIGRR